MRATLKDVEVRELADGSTAYHFSKRLNPSKGNFAGFSARFKRKLVAGSDSEATVQAQKLANRLDQLQLVCLRDQKGLSVSSLEMHQAAATWFELINGIDLSALHHDQGGRFTMAAQDAQDSLEALSDEVTSHWGSKELGYEGDVRQWLTPFGALLLSMIQAHKPSLDFIDCFDIYLRQTNRAHLEPSNRAVARPSRVLREFAATVGNKSVAEISRRDVEVFIEKRLSMDVRTTTVRREVAGLRAIWTQVANVLEIQTRNPFERQPIHGLGSDSRTRYPLSAEETRAVLQLAERHHRSRPRSYVAPLLAIAALTGARLGEIHGLVDQDFDRADAILWIQPNDKRESLKTKNSRRPIPVLPELALWLERFLGSDGTPTEANSCSASCLKLLKTIDTGKKGFTIHGLRHGFKQRLVEVDCPGNLIDELMGWSQQSTSRHYGFNTVTQKKIDYVMQVYGRLHHP